MKGKAAVMQHKLLYWTLIHQDLFSFRSTEAKHPPTQSVLFPYTNGENSRLSKNAHKLRKETCVFSPVEPPGFLFLCNRGWHGMLRQKH